MKHKLTPPPAADWTLEHPWLYIYTVITAWLLAFQAVAFLLDWLKGLLP